MNAVFVDTSALLALLDAKDQNHAAAKRAFARLRDRQASLVSTSFVLVETYALVGRRFGLDAVRSFRADFAPLIDVVWVDEALHDAGLDLLLERRKRLRSLVDAVSFVAMRRKNVDEAFACDPHLSKRDSHSSTEGCRRSRHRFRIGAEDRGPRPLGSHGMSG